MNNKYGIVDIESGDFFPAEVVVINSQSNSPSKLKQSKENRESGFQSFYQVNRDIGSNVIAMTIENPTAVALLLLFLSTMDNYNVVRCSYLQLQDALQKSKSTIQRSIKYLKNAGFIDVQKQNNSTVYIVNPQAMWGSYGVNKQYCKFSITKYITQSEESDRIKKHCAAIRSNRK